MDGLMKGKSILVTGATSGIGKAVAARFVRAGSVVHLGGRRQETVDSVVEELGSHGTVWGITADLSTAEGVDDLYRQATADGPLDVVVCNVSIHDVQAFEAITDADWQRYFDVNVMSAVRVCRRALPIMLHRHFGRIIILSGEAAVKPLPEMLHYSVTMTALLGLARGMAELTKGTGVTVNSVLPGPGWTETVAAYFTDLARKEGKGLDTVVKEYFRKHEPSSLIQRFIAPAEVAEAVFFACTTGAINGESLRIDGGSVRSIV